MWYIVALFAVLTVILLSGKGAFLVAGYNTASKKEKAKYDEKKMSRVTGAGTGVITILLAVFAAFEGNPPAYLAWLLGALFLITIVLMLVLTNTMCKSENVQAAEESEADKKRHRIILICTIAFLVILSSVIGVSLFTGDIEISITNTAIDIDGAFWPDQSISLDEIQSVTYKDNIDVGRRTNGYGSVRLQQGHFKNAEFGNYILYAYTQCNSYIVIHTSSGIFVINTENSSETEKLYKYIESRLSN